MPRYLGLDSSTQSLSALVIDTEKGCVVLEESVNFGRDLPAFEAPNGFLESPDPKLRHSNPLMWVAALDLVLDRAKHKGFDWGSIAGISGAGQQHGSVYLGVPIGEAPSWSSDESLKEQVAPLLSRPSSPIWMDSSTAQECAEISRAVGGDARMVSTTGSRAIERFTGPQIRKFWKTEPAAYDATREIHLVSSFMGALLTQTSAPIDFGDATGMNLLDLSRLDWNPELLDATAPALADRLRKPIASSTRIGAVAPYFVARYGFTAGTPVIAFTGDNPSSLVGMGATEPGTWVVSLGTSDTVFASMREPRTDPRGFGHVFGNPAGGFMSLLCFANGSLAREALAKKVALDWPAFEAAILYGSTPGNGGALLLPYFAPEITPRLARPQVSAFGDAKFVAMQDPPRAARAIVEAQALAMERYSDFIGERPKVILATGGASRNRGILQVISDVFQADVKTLKLGNSSGLGAALRAAHGVSGLEWPSLFERFAAPDAALGARPNPKVDYAALRARFAEAVDALLAIERNSA